MAFETREFEGSLFPNNRKQTDQQPDFTGNVRIGGVLYRLAGWKRTGKTGGPCFVSLKASLPQPEQQSAEPAHSTAVSAQDFDDSVPF